MEKKITNQELDIILQNMTEREFTQFVEKLPDDLKELFLMRRALVKLFSDRDYYNAVRSAVCERISKEVFE